jgi:hypothetical protein
MFSKCTNCSPTSRDTIGIGPRTTIDNDTAYGILNETIKQKRSKSMDMKYYWLQDRVCQKHFDIYWLPGKDNLADYHIKHHPAQHHQDMHPILFHPANSLHVL